MEIRKKSRFLKAFHEHKACFVMLAPFTILFLVFTIIPIVSSIYLSFTNFNMLQPPEWIGTMNYVSLFFSDDVFLIAIKNTLIFALITGPIGFILSFILAWFINEFKRWLKAILTLVFYAPSLAGNVYFIWLYLFSEDSYGFINSKLMSMDIIKEPILWLTDPKYNLQVVIIVIIWLSMGAGFLAFIAGLQTIDRSLFEAGAIDGIKNRWQELWYITIPQMVPQLLFGTVMSISTSFAVGYQSMALTGFPSTDYSTHTIVLHIFDYGAIRFEMGYASAVSVVLFAAMIAVWGFLNKQMSKISG